MDRMINKSQFKNLLSYWCIFSPIWLLTKWRIFLLFVWFCVFIIELLKDIFLVLAKVLYIFDLMKIFIQVVTILNYLSYRSFSSLKSERFLCPHIHLMIMQHFNFQRAPYNVLYRLTFVF